jgi:hypothetical protein
VLLGGTTARPILLDSRVIARLVKDVEPISRNTIKALVKE